MDTVNQEESTKDDTKSKESDITQEKEEKTQINNEPNPKETEVKNNDVKEEESDKAAQNIENQPISEVKS